MRALIQILRLLSGNVRGATAVEYGLILALVVLALVVGLARLGQANGTLWSNMSQKVQQVGP